MQLAFRVPGIRLGARGFVITSIWVDDVRLRPARMALRRRCSVRVPKLGGRPVFPRPIPTVQLAVGRGRHGRLRRLSLRVLHVAVRRKQFNEVKDLSEIDTPIGR